MLNVPERQSLIETPDLFSTSLSSLNAALETDLTIRSLSESSARTARIEENPYTHLDSFSFGRFAQNSHNFTLPTIAGDSVQILWVFDSDRSERTTFSTFSDSEPYWRDFTRLGTNAEGTYQYIDFSDREGIQVKITPPNVGNVQVSIAKRGNIVARPLNLDNINNGFITWGYNVQSNRTDQSFTLPPGSSAVAKLAYVNETGKIIQLLDQKPVEFRNNINTSFTTSLPLSTPDGAGFIRVFIEKTGPFAETNQEDNTVTVRNPLGKPNLTITEPKFLPGGGIEYGFKVGGNYVEAAPGKQIKIRLIWVGEAGNWIQEADSKLYTPRLPKDFFDSIKISQNILNGKPFEAAGLLAFIDSEQAVTEATEADNATTLLTPFVWDLPEVARRIELPIGSRFLKRWLTGEARKATSSRDFTLDIDTSLTLETIFSSKNDVNGRGVAMYNSLLQSYLDEPALVRLKRKVQQWFLKNPTKSSLSLQRLFEEQNGVQAETQVLFRWSTQWGDVMPPSKPEAAVLYARGLYPDDSFASLGRYRIYVTPDFIARRNGSDIKIEVKNLKIFALDSFDFIKDINSTLGVWSRRPAIYPPYADYLGLGTAVTPGDFESYRSMTQLGRDFLIRSNVRIIPVSNFQIETSLRSVVPRSLDEEDDSES